jgi:hypothetical protein
MSYRRTRQGAEVDLSLTGPSLDLTWIQALPLGARNVEMAGEPNRNGDHEEGPHDETLTTILHLREGDPVTLRFTWEGGLQVEPPGQPVPVGSTSGGLRVLDFTGDDEGWTVVLEGDGGNTHTLVLYGEAVRGEDGEVWTPRGSPGRMELPVSFPGEGRQLRTLHLEPVR